MSKPNISIGQYSYHKLIIYEAILKHAIPGYKRQTSTEEFVRGWNHDQITW